MVVIAFLVCFKPNSNYCKKLVDFSNKIELHTLPFLVLVPFVWTPIIQMLNMSILSGNDYYSTKSILALNLISLSRTVNYFKKKENEENNDDDQFGVSFISFA